MSGSELAPARIDHLVWYRPEAISTESFARLRPRLEGLVAEPSSERVYEAKRRAIHRAVDPELGPVAIKEIRSESLVRGVWFRFGAEHPALREFRIGSAFQARGGRSPEFLGAAAEGMPWSVDRVLIFLRWIEGAVELTEHLQALGARPGRGLLEQIAQRLVTDAELGLVHGRHGTSNLLLVPNEGQPDELQAIDFAYSRLTDRFDPDGYARDAARVAVQMIRLGGVGRDCAREFIEIAADAAARCGADPDRCRSAIERAASDRLVEMTGEPL